MDPYHSFVSYQNLKLPAITQQFMRFSNVARAARHEADSGGRPDRKNVAENIFSKNKTKEGVQTTYSQFFNLLVETYETDYLFYEANNDILSFTEPRNTTPWKFSDALCMKSLRVPRLHNKYILKWKFKGVLPMSFEQSLHTFRKRPKDSYYSSWRTKRLLTSHYKRLHPDWTTMLLQQQQVECR